MRLSTAPGISVCAQIYQAGPTRVEDGSGVCAAADRGWWPRQPGTAAQPQGGLRLVTQLPELNSDGHGGCTSDKKPRSVVPAVPGEKAGGFCDFAFFTKIVLTCDSWALWMQTGAWWTIRPDMSAERQRGAENQTMVPKAWVGWGVGGADMIARKEFQCEWILISDMDINDDSN